MRDLGEVAADRVADFGLDAPETLVVGTREALPLWAPVDRPDAENELYGDWLRMADGLYAVDFPTREAEEPSADGDSSERYGARGEITRGRGLRPAGHGARGCAGLRGVSYRAVTGGRMRDLDHG